MKRPKLLKADETMATSEGSMFEDIVIEILSKLPVKSLLRFKCVCKFWNGLIGSPSFISKHQKNEHNTRLIVHYLADDGDDPHEENLCICLFHDETLADVSLREDIPPLIPRETCPMGPFEWGLFCCISDIKQEIGLWNFATRDYKILRKIKPDSMWTIYGVGLGMDQKSFNDVLKSSDSNQVAIYSFNTNSWRNFQCLELSRYKFEVGEASDGKYQNGACYWFVKPRFETKHPDYKVILSFDLSNEVFQEIQMPDCRYESRIRWPHRAWGVHNDSLSYFVFDENKTCFDIWIMNKESHNYNWTKQFTVTAPFVANDEELEVYEVLGFWKNGAFLFAITDEGHIFLYDPTAEQKFKDLQLDDDITTASIYLYKESLLNVKSVRFIVLIPLASLPAYVQTIQQGFGHFNKMRKSCYIYSPAYGNSHLKIN